MTDDVNAAEIPLPPDAAPLSSLPVEPLAESLVSLVLGAPDRETAVRQLALALELFGDGAATGARLKGGLLALQLVGETLNDPSVYGLGDVRQKLAQHAGTIRDHAVKLGLDVGALGIPRDWPESLRPPSGTGGYW